MTGKYVSAIHNATKSTLIIVGILLRLDAAKIFCEAGIPTTVILDSAVGKYLEFVSLCLVGAEGVMENGGIVNKVN